MKTETKDLGMEPNPGEGVTQTTLWGAVLTWMARWTPGELQAKGEGPNWTNMCFL